MVLLALRKKLQTHFFDTINQVSRCDWQRLNNSSSPFMRYEFFQALENSGSVGQDSGWYPQHLAVLNSDSSQSLNSLMPMYLKSHSWGEYVFDWAWAEAYQRVQLPYYPKLVATLPFTPTPSDKLLSSNVSYQDVFLFLIEHCQQQPISSWHILFCPELDIAHLDDVYQRNTVQFLWFNRQYKSFEHYLESFTARKRKNTRKERLSITKQGISIRRVSVKDISKSELDFFYLTYQLTYMRRGHTPHLTYDFFKEIFTTMADNVLLFIANRQQKDIACALFFYDDTQLFGRYWGSTEQCDFLHFELCYYQGIEFCIENKLLSFNPGTQGEHKIQRGFEPKLTHSYHWIKHPQFKPAIKAFCQQEQQQMQHYQLQCVQKLPFKHQE